MNDPLLRVLEQARKARSEAELNAIDDSVLIEFFMTHMKEWLPEFLTTGMGDADIEDCAGQISHSLLMRINDPSASPEQPSGSPGSQDLAPR